MLTKYALELKVLGLGLLSFLLWSFYVHYLIAIPVFLILFGYLYYTKAPITHYYVVVIFAMISRSTHNYANYDYVLVGILFFATLIKVIKERSVSIGKLSIVLLINLGYALISISYSLKPIDALLGVGSILQGYTSYFIITNNNFKFSKDKILNFSKIASLFLLFITIQFAYKYVVNDVRNVDDVKKAIGLGWQIANLAAPFFVFLIPVSLYKYTIKDKLYYGYFFLDLVNVCGLILSLSRGAYVGLAFALLIFIIINIKNYSMFIRYGIVPVIIAIGLYFIPFINNMVNVTLRSLTQKSFFDDNARYELWNKAIQSFKERPIFGYGINASNHLIPMIGRESHFFHNFILQTAATLGIIGLIMLVILFIQIFKVTFKPKDLFVTIIAAGIIGATIHQLVDVMFDFLMFGMFFYSLIGLLEIYRDNDISDQFRIKRHKFKSKAV